MGRAVAELDSSTIEDHELATSSLLHDKIFRQPSNDGLRAFTTAKYIAFSRHNTCSSVLLFETTYQIWRRLIAKPCLLQKEQEVQNDRVSTIDVGFRETSF